MRKVLKLLVIWQRFDLNFLDVLTSVEKVLFFDEMLGIASGLKY